MNFAAKWSPDSYSKMLPLASVAVYEITPAYLDKSVTSPTTPGIYSACVSTNDLCDVFFVFESSDVI